MTTLLVLNPKIPYDRKDGTKTFHLVGLKLEEQGTIPLVRNKPLLVQLLSSIGEIQVVDGENGIFRVEMKSAGPRGATKRVYETIKRKFETADWSEFKWVRWYAEIRNIERGMPLSRRDFKRVIKIVNQIYKFGSVTTKKSWTMFTDVAIKYIEYSLGAIGTKAAKLNKELTVVKKDPILLMNLLEDI